MITLLTIIQIISAIFMIIVVLVQGGNSGGVSAAFGGGNAQGVFGATGATSFLGKLTYGFAAVFMVTSIGLSMIQSKSGKVGLRERLEGKAGSVPAATTPAPATNNATPAPAGNTGPTPTSPAPATPAPAGNTGPTPTSPAPATPNP